MKKSQALLFFIFCCLNLAKVAADDLEDINSAAQVDMIWNYFQLRPPDLFETTNKSTSLANLAASYYGNSNLAFIIKESNPGLDDIITSIGVKITLPSILKCIEKDSLSCILNSYMVRGLEIPQITLQASLYPLTHPINKGRLLAGVGDEYDLGNDEGHYLVEQFPDLKPTSLRLAFVNSMGTWLNLKYAAEVQSIEMNSVYWHREKLNPPRSVSKAVSFINFQGDEYIVTLTITLNPVATFPFFYPAQQNTISAVVTGPSGFSKPISDIFPTQGCQSILIGSPVNLNLTLSLDNDFGTTTAVAIFQEYYSKTIEGFLSRIAFISPIQNVTIALQRLKQPINGLKIMTQYLDPTNRGASFAWRFIPTKYSLNSFRIINFVTNEVVTADPNSMIIFSSLPALHDIDQVWTLIPAPNPTSVDPQFDLFYVKNQNLCWSLDKNEPSPQKNSFPLRLKICNPSDNTQIFAFYYRQSNGKLDWNS